MNEPITPGELRAVAERAGRQFRNYIGSLTLLALADILEEVQKMNANFQSLSDALAALQTDVANEDTVIDGAVTLIQGIPTLIKNAVQQAIAAGASAEQLTAFGVLADTITGRASALAAAVASAPSGNPTAGVGVPNPAPTGSLTGGSSTPAGGSTSAPSGASETSPTG